MSNWVDQKRHHVVTAILPRRTSNEVTDFLLDKPARFMFELGARGTVVKDRWYQFLLPIISPEQEIIQFLLPHDEVDIIMEQIVALGQLRLAGAGAVFTYECSSFTATADFPVWQNGEHTEAGLSMIKFKRNLVGIAATVQSSISETVARSAIKAGAHGPTIHYCEGRGVRDRLGILRFTQNPDKEIIRVIVDDMDADAVFDAMATAGRLTEPGRGIIYTMPINRGMIKLPGVTQSSRYAASIHQIIHAIDDLKGCADWRATSNLIDSSKSSGGALSFLGIGPSRSRKYLYDLQRITCTTKRKNIDILVNAALEAGAPGATSILGRFMESECKTTGAGVRINRELGTMQFILGRDQMYRVIDALKAATDEHKLETVAIYTAPVGKVLTYLG
ncbi:P-II family nitrogen regulator [Cerasicoccus fimbriatus]|uniref:P-II family nitrogen regulator n=1 Tax=Cerasicoccus fimbriatus TaxID=3014554 RepID=UPI0022B3DDBD|nr:P-II family nitrogen regulator [Cerasicoccus sp. TK19100]